MHIFLLKNTGLIEEGCLTDAVETFVFTAIHEKIVQKLERRLWEVHDSLLMGMVPGSAQQ